LREKTTHSLDPHGSSSRALVFNDLDLELGISKVVGVSVTALAFTPS